ncbi:MAG: hypothetical protein ACM3JI_01625, partial [Anaerolineae bacterium]
CLNHPAILEKIFEALEKKKMSIQKIRTLLSQGILSIQVLKNFITPRAFSLILKDIASDRRKMTLLGSIISIGLVDLNLLSHCEINLQSTQISSILFIAFAKKVIDLKILELFVERGLQVNPNDSSLLNFSLVFAFKHRKMELLRLAIRMGSVPNEQTKELLKDCTDPAILELCTFY